MEKRLTLFFVLSVAILLGHQLMQTWLNPPAKQRPVDDVAAGPEKVPSGEPESETPEDAKPRETKPGDTPAEHTPTDSVGTTGDATLTPGDKPAVKTVPLQWATLGSLDPDTGYRLLVTLTNRGAAIERVEISSPRYRDVVDKTGYLGHLKLEDRDQGPGARIRVVGPGTPAAMADPAVATSGMGLHANDVILDVDGVPVEGAGTIDNLLANSHPGQSWKIVVDRQGEKLTYEVTLVRQPLAVIRPESQASSDPLAGNPPSCVFTIATFGGEGKQLAPAKGDREIDGLPSLAEGHWEITQATEDLVEFRQQIDAKSLAALKQTGDLEILRRYSLKPAPADQIDQPDHPAYHIEMAIELRTTSQKGITLAGKLSGPNGLPIEGWWYTTKISGQWFSSGGARDVARWTDGTGHQLLTCQEIHKVAAENPPNSGAAKSLFTSSDPEPKRTVRYLGVDAQYFAAMLMPQSDEPRGMVFREASAVPIGDARKLDKARNRTLNVSFELTTESHTVKADKPWVQEFVLFAGPKHPDLLGAYGKSANGAVDLNGLLEYGWFGWVARPLSRILHGIYAVVRNYGIAIVLLTILVRSCMLPVSHRAAKNTQKMQLLAPEMKKIGEMYKNDMEKRGKAQQELYRRHGINPLSGCLLALCQLPIFIGLYRCISVDIELRQAPLIPGWEWASNLSGPDMLWYWQEHLPAALASETGYLGPYFNLLPLITIALFLFNQKMLTPPPTDDQTRMQHNVMMVMTVFIGVMFFKVPGGLCTYFVSSSIWSLSEHKLLRKNKNRGATGTLVEKSTALPERRVKR